MKTTAERILESSTLAEKLSACKYYCAEWDAEEQSFNFSDDSKLYFKDCEGPLSLTKTTGKKIEEKMVKITISEGQKELIKDYARKNGLTEDQSLEELVQVLFELHCESALNAE